MQALGRAARRLQLATGSHGDNVRSVASVMHPVQEATSPAAAPDRAEQRPLHSGRATLPCCAAADVPPSSAGLRTLVPHVSPLRRCGVSEDVAASSVTATRSATRCATLVIKSYSAATAHAADRAWPGQTPSGSPAGARHYSAGAAFVSEHGGGTFRTTGDGGGGPSAPHGACSRA